MPVVAAANQQHENKVYVCPCHPQIAPVVHLKLQWVYQMCVPMCMIGEGALARRSVVFIM